MDGIVCALALTAIALSLELGLRISIGSARLVANAVNAECSLDVNQYLSYLDPLYLTQNAFDTDSTIEDQTPDDGSPGVNGRIAKRTDLLMRRFQPVFMQEIQDLTAIHRVVTEVEADLRHYCSDLDDNNEGIRFGLSRLKAFIDMTWDPGEVSFDPPELQSGD
ncbi:MAG: hypothetical protein EOO77_44715 [Oxalobacteraceae bacterium]|nr:MAG: hypothetical protein EOO77_44715 [Oxalobacteraceae bacterium]